MESNFKRHSISLDDIEILKSVYDKGEENAGDDPDNIYNTRFSKEKYNLSKVSAKTFFCDLNNDELMDVVRKYIPVAENEYISNVHYINYGVGERANPHIDYPASIATFLILLSDDFEGGEFYLNNEHIPFQKGEILEFDANIIHEVKPVLKGNREVLVTWLRWNNKNKKTLM